MTDYTAGPGGPPARVPAQDSDDDFRPIRGDETKPSFKTSEFWVYLAAVAAVLLASQLVGDDDPNTAGGDAFAADKAWWYITILTFGYLVSRGLAKAGSRSRDRKGRTH